MSEAINQLVLAHQAFGFSYNTVLVDDPKITSTIRRLLLAYNCVMVSAPIIFISLVTPYLKPVLTRYSANSDLMTVFVAFGYLIKMGIALVVYLQTMVKGRRLIAAYQLVSTKKDNLNIRLVLAVTLLMVIAGTFSQATEGVVSLKLMTSYWSSAGIGLAYLFVKFCFEAADFVVLNWLILFALAYIELINQLADRFQPDPTGNQLANGYPGQHVDQFQVDVYKKLLFIKRHVADVGWLLSPGLIISVINWCWNLSILAVVFMSRQQMVNWMMFVAFVVTLSKLSAVGYFGERISKSLKTLTDAMEQYAVDNDWGADEVDQLLMIKDLQDDIRFSASGFFDLKGSFLMAVAGVILQNVVIMIQTFPLIK